MQLYTVMRALLCNFLIMFVVENTEDLFVNIWVILMKIHIEKVMEMAVIQINIPWFTSFTKFMQSPHFRFKEKKKKKQFASMSNNVSM